MTIYFKCFKKIKTKLIIIKNILGKKNIIYIKKLFTYISFYQTAS